MTSWDLMKLIAARRGTPFCQRQNYMVIPNVSWGFLNYEADMLVVTKSKYVKEIEVKISMADWKADFKKRKHKQVDERISYQYYACPMELATRHLELKLPEGWGVIGVAETGKHKVLVEADKRWPGRKLTDHEILILARLACFRVWRNENA